MRRRKFFSSLFLIPAAIPLNSEDPTVADKKLKEDENLTLIQNIMQASTAANLNTVQNLAKLEKEVVKLREKVLKFIP